MTIHLDIHVERTARGDCAECARIRAKKWARKNPERVKKRAEDWRIANRERDLKNKRGWRLRNNIEAVKIYQKRRYDPVKQKVWNLAAYARRKAAKG